MASPSAYKWKRPPNGLGWWLTGFRGKKLAHLWPGRDGRTYAYVFLMDGKVMEPAPRGPFETEEIAMNRLVDEMIPHSQEQK